MKYCKKCGILYSDILSACPKCGTAQEEPHESPPEEATKRMKVRQWIALCVGIPAFVGVMYLVIWCLKTLSGR
jgi:uncharacterized membrane protein YvbJ